MAGYTKFLLGKVEKRVLRALLKAGGQMGIANLCLEVYGKTDYEVRRYMPKVIARLKNKGLVDIVLMSNGSQLVKLTKQGMAEVLRRRIHE